MFSLLNRILQVMLESKSSGVDFAEGHYWMAKMDLDGFPATGGASHHLPVGGANVVRSRMVLDAG